MNNAKQSSTTVQRLAYEFLAERLGVPVNNQTIGRFVSFLESFERWAHDREKIFRPVTIKRD